MMQCTPPRPPIDISHPIITLLLEQAENAELIAPAIPYIVTKRCSAPEETAFRGLSRLLVMYKDTGRTCFTEAEIADISGVSRGRVGRYLRSLADKEMIDVIGHQRIPGLPEVCWPAMYKIDKDRLRKMSAAVVLDDLIHANRLSAIRMIPPSEGQIAMEFAAGGQPPPSSGGGSLLVPSFDGSSSHPARAEGQLPSSGGGGPLVPSSGGGSSHPARAGGQPPPSSGGGGPLVPSQAGGDHHHSMVVGADHQPVPSFDGGDHHHSMVVGADHQPVPSFDGGQDGRHHHHSMVVTPDQPATTIIGWQSPPSNDGVVGMGGGKDVSGEVGERAAHAPAPEIAILFQQTISPLKDAIAVIQQTLAALPQAHLATPGATFTPVPPPPDEPIPAAPAGEPALDTGPVALWGVLNGRVSGIDGERIKEIVRRFEQPSAGHAAYWLARALSSVALEDAPLSLNYAAGILRRMQEHNDWSTSELMRRPKESRPEPTDTAPERVQRGKVKTSPASETPSLPDEVAQHGAIAAWRRYAGPAVAITLPRAQEIIVKVTDLPVWEAVLTNWQVQYQARANWGHFEGLLERYAREMAAGSAPPAESAALPDLSARWIQLHPGLSLDERAAWVMRFHRAGGKAEKRALLTRFLAEHPITEGELLS